MNTNTTLFPSFLHLYSVFRTAVFRYFTSVVMNFRQLPSLVAFNDLLLTIYFLWCGLSSSSIHLDEETTIHCWATKKRRFSKPALVLVHGFGGNSKWQWRLQIKPLIEKFDIYIPDLVFFGKSSSTSSERSEFFQARCIGEALRKLGVDRFSVCGISYGGFVVYRMAELFKDEIDKVVIMSSGLVFTSEQRVEYLEKKKQGFINILLPEKPEDLMSLMKQSFFRPPAWTPTFLLQDFINVMYRENRRERIELLEGLVLMEEGAPPLPVLTKETLIIWGDKDGVFPVILAHQLKRHLGHKSRLSILKEVGHASQLESPSIVNDLIKLFLLS